MTNNMFTKIKKALVTSFVVYSLPVMLFAQTLTKTEGLFQRALDIVRTILIPLVFTLALLFFFWGVAKYIWADGEKKEDGRKIMIWGIVALFVMSTVWGLVAFLQNELLGGPGDSNMRIPTIGGSGPSSQDSGGFRAGPDRTDSPDWDE